MYLPRHSPLLAPSHSYSLTCDPVRGYRGPRNGQSQGSKRQRRLIGTKVSELGPPIGGHSEIEMSLKYEDAEDHTDASPKH